MTKSNGGAPERTCFQTTAGAPLWSCHASGGTVSPPNPSSIHTQASRDLAAKREAGQRKFFCNKGLS
jgi:hypothetical protein